MSALSREGAPSSQLLSGRRQRDPLRNELCVSVERALSVGQCEF